MSDRPTDRMDARLNALVTELATAAPLAPPMPPLEPAPRRFVAGVTTAGTVFAAVVVVVALAVVAWHGLSGRDATVAATEVFESTGATPVAVVTQDGETLGGYLWQGGSTGTLIVSAYGEQATELLTLATSAHAAGGTVMLVDPRGQGRSSGEPTADLLVTDIEAAISDLRTRGARTIVLVGVRHAATAAIALSVDAPDSVSSIVAFFPFEQYQGIDAIGVVGEATVPLTIVGASAPSHLGPWAGHLTSAAPVSTTGILLPPLPPNERFLDYYMPEMIAILDAVVG
jgi:hypothetical protein